MKLLLIGLLVPLVLVLPAEAQEADTGVWRVEITDYQTSPAEAGFWASIRRSLFGRAAVQRPPIGTSFTVQSSAYAPSPYQTDATPCITAAGTRVRRGVVASNFLPFGTRLDINGESHIVEDRMNPRYDGYFVDLWFPSTSEALEFGRQELSITIIGYGDPGETLLAVPVVEQQPSFITTTGQRLREVTRTLGRLLGANVNQFDVPCFD